MIQDIQIKGIKQQNVLQGKSYEMLLMLFSNQNRFTFMFNFNANIYMIQNYQIKLQLWLENRVVLLGNISFLFVSPIHFIWCQWR